jgi:GntR family transcriptional regulator/MocR family aminotransferase
MRTSSAPDVLLQLDRQAPEALHRQVERLLRDAVRSGRLRAGSALPSSRVLARELEVSRGIVVEAYEQLAAEGYVSTRPGGKTRVARRQAPIQAARPVSSTPSFEFDFRPGRPDLEEFPREAWLRSVRRSLASAPAGSLSYLDGRGLPELRVELAAHLNRARGTAAHPDDLIITAGFAQGLFLTASILRAAGARRFALEDPTLGDSRLIIAAAGLEPIDIPVDGDGLRVDLLARTRAAAVLTTPAHQYPTGRVLSAERRAELLAWAERRGTFIVEDDYDAEYRYDRKPVGAMQGLRPDRVIYAGSASKLLAPGLRLGWFIAPPELAEPMVALKKTIDHGSPAIDQLAFADFIARGDLDRHLRRMRPIYRHRRDHLLSTLRTHLPELHPEGASAGMHVLAWLPPELDPDLIVDGAASIGIGLGSVPRGSGGAPEGRGALVFGYGSIPDRSVEPGIRRFARLWRKAGWAAVT